jgi:hypothetical protein
MGRAPGYADRVTPSRRDERGRRASRWRIFVMRVAMARARFANRLTGDMGRLAYRATLVRTRLRDRLGVGRGRLADPAIPAKRRHADGRSRWWTTFTVSVALLGFVASSGFLVVRVVDSLTRVEPSAPSASAQPGEGDTPVQDREGGSAFSDAVPSESPSPGTEGQLPDVTVYVNKRSGYLFSYPTPWTITQIEGADRLVDPAGDVQITFDVAPAGPLETVSELVVEQATRDYSNVELIESSVETTPQGLPSLVVGVSGIGPSGETVRLLVITMQGQDGNRTITVRFSQDADPRDALPVIQQIVSSFRVSNGA